MSWSVPPWVYPAWDFLCFLDLVDFFLSCVKEVFSCYLFKYFLRSFLSLSSPSGTPMMQMLVCLMSSQRFLRLSSFFFFFHSLFYILFSGSDFHHSVFRSLICSSASVILLLIPCSVLSLSVCSLILLGLSRTFLASSPFFFRDKEFTIIILNSFFRRQPLSTSFSCFSGVLSCPFI